MAGYSPASRTASVTVPSTGNGIRILDRNLERRTAIIVNDSSQVIYLGFGPGAAMNAGIRLNANGGAIWFGKETDIKYEGEVWGIAASNSNVTVTEY